MFLTAHSTTASVLITYDAATAAALSKTPMRERRLRSSLKLTIMDSNLGAIGAATFGCTMVASAPLLEEDDSFVSMFNGTNPRFLFAEGGWENNCFAYAG